MTIIMFQLLSLLLSSLLLQTNNNTSSTMNMVCSALYLQPGIQPPGGGAHHHNTSPIKKKKTTTTTEQLLCEKQPSLPIITNDGETIPTKVIEYTEKQKIPTTTTNKIRGKDEEEGRHFWLDHLGTDSMKLVQEQLIMTNRGDSNTTTTTNNCFSLLSWNILCESYYHRKEKCSNYIPWSLRSQSILQILENADSDIVCLQEVDYDWFHAELLPNMMTLGYDGVVQGKKTNGTSNDDTTSTNNTNNNNDHLVVEIKRRKNKSVRAHAVATFWKTNRFEAHPGFQQQQQQQQNEKKKKKTKKAAATTTPTFSFAHMARGRTLTSLLRQKQQHDNDKTTIMNDATAAIMNCHLEGHPRQYAARIRQLQHGMKDLVKYTTTTDDTTASTTTSTTTTKLNALLVAGDFNCELASSASSVYLERGRVGKRSGLGGVHGTSATWAMPPSVLECDEACAVCNPLLEWNVPLPDDELDSVQPHPFRRNSLLSAYSAVSSSFSRTTDDDDRHYSLHPDDFTYCANPYKPVAGLDQIWYSGSSLQRVALKRVFQTEEERLSVLEHGLPLLLAQQPYYNHPSDHLPIGAVMQWKTTKKQQEQEEQLVELTIAKEQVVRAPKPKSPIMAYAELDRLLVTGPFDSEPQRLEVERILESYTLTINLPDNPKEKPSPEQLVQLKEVRERKQRLLQTASEPTRLVLQRIFQLKKKVAVY